jgi:hypothetical protein
LWHLADNPATPAVVRYLAPIPKHEPMSDIDTAVVDSLKALDPKRPISEADIIYVDCGCPRAGVLPSISFMK